MGFYFVSYIVGVFHRIVMSMSLVSEFAEIGLNAFYNFKSNNLICQSSRDFDFHLKSLQENYIEW